MKIIKVVIVFLLFSKITIAQTELDLSLDKGNTRAIDVDIKHIKIINAVKNKFSYSIDIKKTTVKTPVFDIQGSQNISGFDQNICSDETQVVLGKLNSAKTEKELKNVVDEAKTYLKNNSEPKAECIKSIEENIVNCEIIVPLGFKLQNNQVVEVIISKYEKGKKDPVFVWTFILKTEEKTRWLVHYGLSYAPSLISKTNKFFAFADTGIANRYTIAKNNENGPKPWDNISATINFTYPFSAKNLPFDLGFTAGFGISAGLELSGHAGLSGIIGENVIISSGLAFMQRHKLRGEYKENQVIKTNLNFEALHEKVWLPELFFTIGFRFGSNPFAKKSTSTPASTGGENAAEQ